MVELNEIFQNLAREDFEENEAFDLENDECHCHCDDDCECEEGHCCCGHHHKGE